MGIRLGVALLIVSLLASSANLLAESSLSSSSSALLESGYRVSNAANICNNNNNNNNSLIGDCIDVEEEMMMDSEASRRQLAGRRSRISRDAMRRSATPCGRRHRGGSYYGCPPANANPYRRGCNRITKCQRNVR